MKSKWERGLPVADRRKRVADLHTKGLTNIVIARRLGIADTTVSQDLLYLGLRAPKTAAAPNAERGVTLAEVYAAQSSIELAEFMTPHRLGRLSLVEIQALFLDGLKKGERASFTGRSAAFTLAELSRDQLIAAVLAQHEKTPAPEYPRVPVAGSAAQVRPPLDGAALAGAGGTAVVTARPEPSNLGPGGDAGDAARPEPARRAS